MASSSWQKSEPWCWCVAPRGGRGQQDPMGLVLLTPGFHPSPPPAVALSGSASSCLPLS